MEITIHAEMSLTMCFRMSQSEAELFKSLLFKATNDMVLDKEANDLANKIRDSIPVLKTP